MRVVGVPVIDGNPIEFRANIPLHIHHQLPGESTQVGHLSGVLRRKGAPRQTTLTVKLMMLDTVAIFGLVGAFVAHDWRLYVPTWALASVGLLRSFPLESPPS